MIGVSKKWSWATRKNWGKCTGRKEDQRVAMAMDGIMVVAVTW
jgi:hypothetical protein